MRALHRSPLPLLLLALLALRPATAQVDLEALEALSARSIGPAGMSGRVAAIAGLASDPNRIYVGAATGGLWQTVDGGVTWRPIFDDQRVASIGAVALHQARPELVWVGTGEGNPRNSSSVGAGVWRSLDGGATWRHVGLARTEKISRIVLHPDDPDVAWVAALGTTWGENPERGVFKTTDGGASWERVLFVDERTGCADLVLDPENPDKLFAAMWQHRRRPDFMESGGPGSGLHLSRDGGASWTRLGTDEGLPEGDLGRIGLAVAASAPNVVYALVEAERSALLRSDDGGRSFRTVNTERDVAPRPFYYADIHVDPQDPDRVYNLHSTVTVSDDGGRSFRTLVGWTVHPDHHALWIDPADPRHLVDGNDGGVAISRDRGETWRFVANLPLAQFYHLAVDMDVPYHVYGGLQDNGSWRGPSTVWENGGIRNHHWQEVGFGDGFATLPFPDDSTRGFAMSQGGALMRWNARTGERESIRPDAPEGVKLRFNWNAGIAICPFHPDTVFYGSQFVHVSPDRGSTWYVASPDLTTDNPEWQRQAESGGLTPDVTDAENHCSILTIAPSPVEHGVIWVGTDDGRVHVTRDDGRTWTSVEQNLYGVPEHTWCPHIEASKFDPAEAFAVFDDHRRSDWTPHVYRTRDYGATWTSLSTPAIDGYAHVIEQDPVDRDLLFLGTEFGLYVSIDGGRAWAKWTHGLPTVAVRALVVHPRDHDLVIGTHGRAAYVLDDVRPLRELSAEVLSKPVHLFELPPAQQHRVGQTGASRFPGNGEFRGQVRPYGALLTFALNEAAATAPAADGAAPEEPKLRIELLDAAGTLLRALEPAPQDGLNRLTWDLRRTGFRRSGPPVRAEELPSGPEVPPGGYTVVVRYGAHEARGALEVLPDPRVEAGPADWEAKWAAIQEHGRMMEALADARVEIERARADLQTLRALAQRADPLEPDAEHPCRALLDAAQSFEDELDTLETRLSGPRDAKGIPADEDVRSEVGAAGWPLSSSWSAPTPAQLATLEAAAGALESYLQEHARVLGPQLEALREAWRASGLELFAPPPAGEERG